MHRFHGARRFTLAAIVALSSIGSAGPSAQAPPRDDLAGVWKGPGTLSYTITQNGDRFEWTDSAGVRGTGRFTALGLSTTWSDAAGSHSALGFVASRDAQGRPTKIVWSNGVIMDRAAAIGAAPPVAGMTAPVFTTPATQQPTPGGAGTAGVLAGLEGRWTSNIGEDYGIRVGQGSATWRARSGGDGRILPGPAPADLTTTWTDAAGQHSATGRVTERDPSGRPTRIEWSHGVTFIRADAAEPPAPATLATAAMPAPMTAPAPVTVMSPGTIAQGQPPQMMTMGVVQIAAPLTLMGLEVSVNRSGADLASFDLADPRPSLCRAACLARKDCRAFTYVRPGVQGPQARCWLKSSAAAGAADVNCWSGSVPAPQVLGGPTMMGGMIAAAPRPEKGPKRLPDDPVAQQRAARLRQYLATWKTAIPGAYAQANQQLAALQSSRFAAQVAGLTQLSAQADTLPRLIGDPAALSTRLSSYAMAAPPQQVALMQMGVLQPIPPGAAAALSLPPAVHHVISAGSNAPAATIDEGREFFIKGQGFGSTPGVLRLQYTSQAKEFAAPAAHTIDLLPAGDSWAESWSDSAIGVRLPYLPQIEIQPGATLTLLAARSNAVPLAIPVTLARHQIGIGYMAAAPMYPDLEHAHALVPRGQVVLVGNDFGQVPGSIQLQLTEPITPYGRPPLTLIDLNPHVAVWTNDRIVVNIPDVQGNYPYQGARLLIRNTRQQEVMQGVVFGPRMMFEIVSGFDHMEFAQEDSADTAEQAGGILTVVHDPGCGLSGNSGNDWFFSAKPLPPNTSVARVMFRVPNPDEPSLGEQLFDEALDWLKKGIYMKIIESFGLMFASIFDSSIGSYKTNLNQVAVAGLPERRQVHWENTCFGPYDGLPNVYHLSFVLWTPER